MSLVKDYLKSLQNKTISMRTGLLSHICLLMTLLISGVLVIVLVFGFRSDGMSELNTYMDNELENQTEDILESSNRMSLKSVAMAELIAKDMEEYFSKNNINYEEMLNNPELVENILQREITYLLNTIDNNICSGVFVVLDTTVNTSVDNWENSRAGIFLKRTEPNSISPVNAKIHYLRGPAKVAIDNKIELLGQWKMEFDVAGQPIWNDVIKVAKSNPDKKLSKLIYVSDRILLKDNSESGILFCVPLRATNGDIYGVCGIEMSARLFKGDFSPVTNTYSSVFTVLSPITEDRLILKDGLIAGNSFLTEQFIDDYADIVIVGEGFKYRCREKSFVGRHKVISLYSEGSPYYNQMHAISVMMPSEDVGNYRSNYKKYVIFALIILVISGIICAIFSSIKYLSEQDKSENVIKSVSEVSTESSPYKTDIFKSFISNIEQLSPAEKSVFDLYCKGHTSKEVTEILCISINTVKTHNRRIFMKLNVSNIKELMVYINMMNEMEGKCE